MTRRTQHRTPPDSAPERLQSRGPSGELAVEARGLTKSYGTRRAVDGVSLGIRRGEVFGLLGSNGAGKTSTVEMIAGLRSPDAGEVRILGLNPWRDRTAVRQILGVQLQEAMLHGSLTCRELVRLYRSFYPDPLGTDEALSMVELTDKASTRFDDLSGGQMQRLSIALALVGDPSVVILDELTTGLDPRARRRIWALIESLQDRTVLLVSHAMDEVETLCDRLAILDAGQIIAEGTPEQVRQKAGADTLEDAFVTLTGGPITTEEDDDEH
ncbi:ABC transporter ATP-binding protein [Nesterenkonia sp. HG001]|uniref:ABC transporter ATP-binding protein n=1 Tax=Nesterenkonia sp. HG001 TaxID=2983207 RepID=UPI002AC485E0|nr:ABC transporter ATP-binding protein [Nesterenkonia sp. HG001]MDZ5078581.1 ABC transporter ATP-binding protein [Nesterenkonia sp. HG001]